MNRKLMITILALATLLLTSFAVSAGLNAPTSLAAAGSPDDYYFRHPGLSIPVTGGALDTTGSDYFERHRAEISAARGPDLTDYAFRHPELIPASVGTVDTTDWFQRHPGSRIEWIRSVDMTDYYFRLAAINGPSARPVDTTDYFFRHPELNR
jgi:hypothetical protein